MTRSEKNKIFKIYRTINALAIGGKGNFMEYKNLVDEIVSKGDYNYFKMTLLIRYRIEVSNYRSINEMKNSTWESICFQTLTPTQQKLKVLYKQKNIYQNGYDVYSDNPKYLTFTHSGPLSSTYSQLATQSHISFDFFNGLVNMKFTNNPLATGATGPYLHNIRFQMVKYVDGEPVNLEYYTEIDSGTYSYFMGGSYKIPLSINPFIEFGTNFIITTKSRNVGSNDSIKQYYKMIFGLGRIAQLQEDISIYYRNSQLAQKLGKKRTFLKATKKGQTDGTLFMSVDFNVSEEMNLYYRYRNAVEYLLS